MNNNEKIIHDLYTAFAALDAKSMGDLYAPNVHFMDPIFPELHGGDVKIMWEMLCSKAQDFTLTFSDVEADDEYGTARWEAVYRFSSTGRKVHNKVKAHFRFKEGKIIEHMDYFRFWTWSSQALGLSGTLLGWSGFFQKKVQKGAALNLKKFQRTLES